VPKIANFREYIDQLRAHGELQDIDVPVDLNLEIGAITRRSYELRSPAPFFNSIVGFPSGFRMVGAPVGESGQANRRFARIALSLGLPAESSATEIIEYMSTWSRTDKRRAIRILENAPCQEHLLLGKDVDMSVLPSPLLHDGDGGRYFGTLTVIVMQSPDKKWTNWSVNRCMSHHDKDKLNVNFSGSKHAAIIHGMWQKLNKPTPVAVIQGVDPLLFMIASTPLPDYVSEAEVLGGFLDENLEMVRCKTIDLYVPASSEIVIEGYIGPDDYSAEGPMGEYCGFLSLNASKQKPFMNVTGITYRNQAIIPVCVAGYPPEENHTCWGTAIAASIFAELQAKSFPVTTCFVPFESCVQWLVVAVDSKRQPTESDPDSTEFVRKVGDAVFATRGGKNIPKVIVVHDDVDPSDMTEVAWALATRCHPGIGEIHFEHLEHNPLEISLHSDEISPPISTKTAYNCLFAGRAGLNLRRSSFKHIFPDALQQKVIANWSNYGYR